MSQDTTAGTRPPTAFAVDFDRTLTGPDLAPDADALAAVAQLRAGGVRCFLLTGRSRSELAGHPELGTAFDGFCFEGGAQWGSWDAQVGPENASLALAAADRVEAAGVPVLRRVASFSCPRDALQLVQQAAADCSLQVNRDRIDVLPAGLDKGLGLDAVLGHALLRAAHVVALGDGENDVPMLEAADVGLAPADGAPEAKAAADEILASAGPASVVEAARRILAGDWPAPISPPS